MTDLGFSEEDLSQIKEHGLSPEEFGKQLDRFKTGFPVMPIKRPALLDDGVRRLSDSDVLEEYYQGALSTDLDITKFVPASGAASRMFKNLLAYLNGDEAHLPEVRRFCEHLENFAFYPILLSEYPDLPQMVEEERYRIVLGKLLLDQGLNYSCLPKALLPFFSYPEGFRTAFEEHLEEAVAYIAIQAKAEVHFTVAAEHLELFKSELKSIRRKKKNRSWTGFDISFSTQDESTDTVAVSLDNQSFRQLSGDLLFRPGGHGALLKNLNAINADLIFIKNVDNVLPDKQKPLMIRYKKAIGGLALKEQSRVFDYILQLEQNPTELLASEIFQYLKSVGIEPAPNKQRLALNDRCVYLLQMLDRPLRVCSVIRPDEPTGGGPFWVANDDGDLRLQIVENAQLDATHAALAARSQFAHITDMVCAVRNYRGEKFDLFDFVDPETGFITEKSYQGQAIKALEHPGLWNGGMAGWNTMLVEIQKEIFRPVKEIWDLFESQSSNL